MSAATTSRKTASERRDSILTAALVEFAARGLHGTSTEAIARRAGISQPYLFRLFSTKKELFIASVERCMRETRETFEAAASGHRGEAALRAMGEAYVELLDDRNKLLAQMQSYAACDDPDVRAVVRRAFGELFEYVERATGARPPAIAAFFAKGMLLNVVATMDLLRADEGWARRLIQGCREG